jgi:hypothetical protein
VPAAIVVSRVSVIEFALPATAVIRMPGCVLVATAGGDFPRRFGASIKQ